MATRVLSLSEFYQLYKDTVIGLSSELTDFSDGSLHDIVTGALSAGLNEICELIITNFSKTYFELAEGADLSALAVDHFGDEFARPLAAQATGVITFSRPSSVPGNVTIPIGTIVKTAKDSNGQEIRFATTEAVILTGLTIDANIEAVNAGVSGNAGANKIIILEGSLTDPTVTVTNAAAMAGGTEAPDDPTYREIIKSLIRALAGATEAAIKGAALSVPGVALATPITIERVVIDYDIGTSDILIGATYFRIPYVRLYIADSGGNSSPALIQAVKDKLVGVKAAGVKIEVLGAISLAQNWTASLTLNAGGPNFAELQNDLEPIKESMREYINAKLGIGVGFIKADANAYILSTWGPSGTNDLTSFTTSVPSGNVSVAANQKLTAGTIGII